MDISLPPGKGISLLSGMDLGPTRSASHTEYMASDLPPSTAPCDLWHLCDLWCISRFPCPRCTEAEVDLQCPSQLPRASRWTKGWATASTTSRGAMTAARPTRGMAPTSTAATLAPAGRVSASRLAKRTISSGMRLQKIIYHGFGPQVRSRTMASPGLQVKNSWVSTGLTPAGIIDHNQTTERGMRTAWGFSTTSTTTASSGTTSPATTTRPSSVSTKSESMDEHKYTHK
ncbi:uncharacterized protein LOC119591348 isoform X2 [Penaeus monodon]|uniref:uncharacterized protein LOC119591348 isoform X2 n=1 Tax=Penaeus monodon TaxID=6687 RepID=UPI0018A7BD77|nr:uncharacterized protein LOC119591348 isoform X2 [Penaeus monodon]